MSHFVPGCLPGECRQTGLWPQYYWLHGHYDYYCDLKFICCQRPRSCTNLPCKRNPLKPRSCLPSGFQGTRRLVIFQPNSDKISFHYLNLDPNHLFCISRSFCSVLNNADCNYCAQFYYITQCSENALFYGLLCCVSLGNLPSRYWHFNGSRLLCCWESQQLLSEHQVSNSAFRVHLTITFSSS